LRDISLATQGSSDGAISIGLFGIALHYKFYTERHFRNPKFKIKFPFLRKSYPLMTHLGGIVQ